MEEEIKMTYDNAISKIEEIVEKLEDNQLGVDELEDKVKEVSTLIKFCREKLLSTGKEVDEILKSLDE